MIPFGRLPPMPVHPRLVAPLQLDGRRLRLVPRKRRSLTPRLLLAALFAGALVTAWGLAGGFA